jgi:hypothetical protein
MQFALRLSVILLLAVTPFTVLSADNKATEQKFAAILIWGTDDEKPQDKDLKEVDEALKEKFSKLPVKWKNFYEVTRKNITVKVGEPQHFKLSSKCEVKINQTKNEGMDLELIGDGKTVYKGTRSMPTKDILILGGDDKNATAWFVVLKPE